MNNAEKKKLDMELRLLRNTNFKNGEPDGFNRCMGTAFYALMDISNYKSNGLTKVWEEMKVLDQTIKETKKGPQSSYASLYDALFDEADIIVDDRNLEKAERFIAEHIEDNSQKQRIANLNKMIALYKSKLSDLVDFEPVEQYADPIKNKKLNAGYEAYKKGIASGFFRFAGMFLYAVLRKTNYKRAGLVRIYNRILEIDNAIEDENCVLNDELLFYALYEETGIICSEAFMPLAQAYLVQYNETKTEVGYRKQVSDILNAYTAEYKL